LKEESNKKTKKHKGRTRTYQEIAEQLIGSITINIANVSLNQEEAIEKIYKLIKKARFIITTGKGRSGYIAQFFANRLGHIEGLGKVWFVDDSTAPGAYESDLVIMISGSGETKSQKENAKTAKKDGAKLIVITSYPESAIGKLADIVIVISGRDIGESESVLPLGTKFELTVLVILEALNGYIIEKDEISEKVIKDRHRNLE